MQTVLELEFIGENLYAYRARHPVPDVYTERYARHMGRDTNRPWVARILGVDPQFGYRRAFQRGHIDYGRTNSTGSRGVFLYYHLDDGVYEVHARTAWRNTRRYFIRVYDGAYSEISQEDVDAWLNATSE